MNEKGKNCEKLKSRGFMLMEPLILLIMIADGMTCMINY